MEIQGWQFKVTLLCLSCCKHWKRGVAMCSSGPLDWINRCFWMQSSYSGIWGCYSVVNSVNNKASLKTFQNLHNNSGFGLGERLAAIIHGSTVLERLAEGKCQLISFGFVFALFILFVWVVRLKFKNQSASYNGHIFIVAQGASSVLHSCIIHTNGWTKKLSTTENKSQDICTT